MKVFNLEPVLKSHENNWRGSIWKKPVIVAAENEENAKNLASERFGALAEIKSNMDDKI